MFNEREVICPNQWDICICIRKNNVVLVRKEMTDAETIASIQNHWEPINLEFMGFLYEKFWEILNKNIEKKQENIVIEKWETKITIPM